MSSFSVQRLSDKYCFANVSESTIREMPVRFALWFKSGSFAITLQLSSFVHAVNSGIYIIGEHLMRALWFFPSIVK